MDFEIEGKDGFRILVGLRFDHLAAPQHVIGQDISPGGNLVNNKIIVSSVIFLVGIDPDQVKRSGKKE